MNLKTGSAAGKPGGYGHDYHAAPDPAFVGLLYAATRVPTVRRTIRSSGRIRQRQAYSSSKRVPPMESGWRKVVAVPWASLWMKRVTRKTTGMKRPRMTARKAPKLTSRPIVPPSTATTPASVEVSCSTALTSIDITGCGLATASLDIATLLPTRTAAGAKADAEATRQASAAKSFIAEENGE